MSHARGILDTSTVIMLGRLDDPAVLPNEPLITAITLAELTVGPLVATSDQERAARQAHLQQAESDFDALPFDASAARAFGRVAASLQQSGRKTTALAGELAHRWALLPRLTVSDAAGFGDDVAGTRAALAPPADPWS